MGSSLNVCGPDMHLRGLYLMNMVSELRVKMSSSQSSTAIIDQKLTRTYLFVGWITYMWIEHSLPKHDHSFFFLLSARSNHFNINHYQKFMSMIWYTFFTTVAQNLCEGGSFMSFSLAVKTILTPRLNFDHWPRLIQTYCGRLLF